MKTSWLSGLSWSALLLLAGFVPALVSVAVEPRDEEAAFAQAQSAARRANVKRLEHLLKTWPNLVKRTTPGGYSLLFDAAASDDAETVKLLIRLGANVELDNRNWTPLAYAAGLNCPRSAKALLENGADANTRVVWMAHKGMPVYRPTALETAATWAHFEFAELLFKHGAKVELHPPTGFSALHLVCRGFRSGDFKSNPEFLTDTKRMISLLVEKGYDINARGKAGDTPLYLSCETGALDITEFLLSRPDVTDVNSIYITDQTALDAVLNHKPSPQRERVVQALRAKGALTMDEIRLKQRQEEKKKRDASNQPVGCATFRWATAC